MWTRCINTKANNYAYYGGRGIKICERWTKFENFLADMGEAPEETSLERINYDGNYEPSNCRWASREEQAFNRRPILHIGLRSLHAMIDEQKYLTQSQRDALKAAFDEHLLAFERLAA